MPDDNRVGPTASELRYHHGEIIGQRFPGTPHGQSPPSQSQLDRPLLSRRPERHRRRVRLLPTSAPTTRRLIEEMARWKKAGRKYPKVVQLPAREHGHAHGRGLRHGDRPRAGGDGARRRGHGEFGDGDAQRAPRTPADRAHGGQGPLHGAGRADRLARQLRALHPGALRPGGDRAALRQVGMDAALGRDDQGDAASRAHGRAQRSHGSGLSDAAARDAHADLGRGRDARLPGGTLRRGALGRGRCRGGFENRREAPFRETSGDGDLVRGPQSRRRPP